MKAVLCRELGSPDLLKVEDIASPVPGPAEVLLQVKACGVSFPDVLMVQGKYQIKPPLPFSPGIEVAGIVKAAGPQVSDFRPGDAVFGRATNGFAEETVAATEFLWHLPGNVDFSVAAGFGMNYATSYLALKHRAQLAAGETLLVLGASGGVGLAAVELGRMMGARVIACASSEDKLALCRREGAHETINYETEDLREAVKRLTGHNNNGGVDVVYDAVGDRFADPAVRSLAWGGRYLVVGFAAGQIPKVALNLPLLKGASLVGVNWGGLTKQNPPMARQLMQELIDLIAAGKLKPHISRVYPLERAGQALQDMMSRRATGKIVVAPGQ